MNMIKIVQGLDFIWAEYVTGYFAEGHTRSCFKQAGPSAKMKCEVMRCDVYTIFQV